MSDSHAILIAVASCHLRSSGCTSLRRKSVRSPLIRADGTVQATTEKHCDAFIVRLPLLLTPARPSSSFSASRPYAPPPPPAMFALFAVYLLPSAPLHIVLLSSLVLCPPSPAVIEHPLTHLSQTEHDIAQIAGAGHTWVRASISFKAIRCVFSFSLPFLYSFPLLVSVFPWWDACFRFASGRHVSTPPRPSL
ncbi:hypothetical protein B0H15DRAFT_950440 [Mycena belliarum]|uniref:Uncharacterized protein n=1 Tax=Mycena belliarum TaxID=1033014 RepID=A0AAD6U2T0_9AGAR|nr:hypothetical protein B0H15DRAFT_950440 [Mycena belliae]